jgi:5-(carboxyamino)imidazole ribonucleotide synthase
VAGTTVGVVGAGQLARMMYAAATRLDLHLKVLATRADESAAQIFADVALGSPDDRDDLFRLATGCDVVTFDHELVDLEVLRSLEQAGHVLRPSAEALSVATDKAAQRRMLGAAGFPLPEHTAVSNRDEAVRFADRHGWPLILKAVRGGYDGRGVWSVGSAEDAEQVLREATDAGLRLFTEPHLDLDREIAVVVARGADGDACAYPVVETIQVEGICREVLAPARIDPGLADVAGKIALGIAETIGAVGILAIEMFVVDGEVVVNELAARPHNSGHLTIDGAATSQFENHLRAVAGLPLGPTHLTAEDVAMVNVLGTASTGDPRERLSDALSVDGVHVHLYGKQPRPGRKIGHVTATGAGCRDRARQAAEILAGGSMGGPRG